MFDRFHVILASITQASDVHSYFFCCVSTNVKIKIPVEAVAKKEALAIALQEAAEEAQGPAEKAGRSHEPIPKGCKTATRALAGLNENYIAEKIKTNRQRKQGAQAICHGSSGRRCEIDHDAPKAECRPGMVGRGS